MGDKVFFSSGGGGYESELWITDGTPENTSLVLDIYPGAANSSYPSALTDVNGTLFFRADDGTHGFELWKSDGTASGTLMVKDILSGSGDTSPDYLVNVDSILYFVAYSSSLADQSGLYRSDGTEAGTFLVKSFPYSSYIDSPTLLTAHQGKLYFAYLSETALAGQEGIWVSDGTEAGTHMVMSPMGDNDGIEALISAGDYVYFDYDDYDNGEELWRTDGTPDGTGMVKNINTNFRGGSSPTSFCRFGDKLLFAAEDLAGIGMELYITDGTGLGTSLVKDIYPDGWDANPMNVTAVGNRAYFTATDGTNGYELWVTDGTEGGTALVKILETTDSEYIRNLANYLGLCAFVSEDPVWDYYDELYLTNGTSGGTTVQTDFNRSRVSFGVNNLTPLGDKLLFAGNGSVYALTHTFTYPVVTDVSLSSANPANTNPVTFSVEFSEGVTGFSAADVEVVESGFSGATISEVTGSGASYAVSVTVPTDQGDGHVKINILDDDTVINGASNPLGDTGLGNGIYNIGPTCFVDLTDPVTTLTSAVASPTALSSFSVTLVLSEPLADLTGSDLSVVNGSVQNFTGSGTEYTFYVVPDGGGTVQVQLPADARTDTAGNGNLASNQLSWEYDTAAPEVLSIALLDATPTNATSLRFQVVFSESVSGVDVTDFQTAGTGLTGISVDSVSAASGTTFTVTVSCSGEGTLGLNVLDDDSIVDDLAQPLGDVGTGNGAYSGSVFYDVDSDVPEVSSISRTGNSPTNSTSLDFQVVFSEDVIGVSSDDFSPTGTGFTGLAIDSVSGANDTYTVTVTFTDGDGNVDLNLVDDDSITDDVGNPLGGSGAGNGNYFGSDPYAVDTTLPSLDQISLQESSPVNGSPVHFDVTFTEAVTGVDAGDFSCPATLDGGASVDSVTGSGTAYVVEVSFGAGDGTLTLNLSANGSIQDGVGNALDAGGSSAQVVVDQNATTVTLSTAVSSPTNQTDVLVEGLFSETVTGLTEDDFVTTNGQVSNLSVGDDACSFTLSAQADGLFAVALPENKVLDGAGNPNLASNVVSLTRDTQGPEVLSITRNNPTPSNLTLLVFQVIFSENVTGVDTTDFTTTETTVSGAAVTDVNGSGTTWTVTVNTGSGSGQLGLALTDDDSIVDGVGNALGGAGAGNGDYSGDELYTIDKTGPSITTIKALDPSPTTAQSVRYAIGFNERVMGVIVENLRLEGTPSDISITGLTGDETLDQGTTFTVTVDTGTNYGTFRLRYIDDDTVSDLVGNPLGGYGPDNGDFNGPYYSVDHRTYYSLTYAAGDNGSLSGDTNQRVVEGGDGTAVSAIADANYHFVNWSDGSTANPRQDTGVTASISVTANFALDQYTLTYTAGAGGSINGTSPQTVDHGSDGAQVEAVAAEGYHFVNWSDGSTANPRQDTGVTASISVTANFAIDQYTLTYTAGTGGSITGTSPQTVDHGSDGAQVEAVAAEGYYFVDWSDGSTANPRQDTGVTASISVTANFALNQYALNYAAGEGGAINGPTTQTVQHGSDGAEVEAVANAKYAFADWSDGSTANPRQDTGVTADISVTANFTFIGVRPPTGPYPADKAKEVSDTVTLHWAESENATHYDVTIWPGNQTKPTTPTATGVTTTHFQKLPGLLPATTYFWQVTAHNAIDSATGPIWAFTTAGSRADMLAVHFYHAILGRHPYENEREYWSGFFQDAVSREIDVRFVGLAMGSSFFNSEEYGLRMSSDPEFIAHCFDAFWFATATAQDIYGWTKGGQVEREYTLYWFARSERYVEILQMLFPGRDGKRTNNFIATIYMGVLDRLPTVEEIARWAPLLAGPGSQDEVAVQMVLELLQSEEYGAKKRTRAVDNRDVAVSLYKAFFGRYPSRGEIDYWADVLDKDQQNLEEVAQDFSDSPEFADIVYRYFHTAARYWQKY